MKLINGTKISVQTRGQDVDKIVDAVCAIDPLSYGLYDRNVLIRRQCTGTYKPQEGSTTHLHLGTTDLQILQYVELEFVLDSSTDLDNVLEAIIAVHHYEEPIIHILPFKPRAPTTIPTRITKIGGGMKKKPDFGSRDLSAR